MNMQSETTQHVTRKKLVARVAGVILLVVALCIATFALSYPQVSVDENTFQTGTLKLNLNGGEQIISDQEFLLEPGRTMVKNFYIENEGTIDVYYNLYLENVSGDLADILDVTIKDGDKVLFEGKASELNKQQPAKR